MERAKPAKVQAIVTVGTDLESSRKAVEFAKRYPGVIAKMCIRDRWTWKVYVPTILYFPRQVKAELIISGEYSRRNAIVQNI